MPSVKISQSTAQDPTLKELFQTYGFSYLDEWNRETLIADYPRFKKIIQAWLENKQKYLASKDWGLNTALFFNELLEEIKKDGS